MAARGIDLPNLGLVIHADLPNDGESLQHRSGRTGRAGRKGVSVLLVPPFRRRRAEDLMRAIGIRPLWSGPPTSEDIRKLDHDRMLHDALITDEPSEEDASAGLALLAAYSPEHLAAALARLYRAGLPAPEEVADPGEPRAARDRAAGRDFDGGPGAGGVWFRLNVGRRNNADPKWLLPLICRRGNVTRKEIGVIRIFDEETAFEVSPAAAERFSKVARKPDGDDVVIEPMPGQPSAPAKRPARGRPERARPERREAAPGEVERQQPSSERPQRAKAYGDEPGHGKPARGKAPHGKAPFDKRHTAKPAGQGKGERPQKGPRAHPAQGKPRGKPPRRP